VRWVDTQETVEVAELLEEAGATEALQAAQASWLRDERQRSSVYTTAETVIEPFVDLATAAGPGGPIEPKILLDGPNTLYLCAPAHDQRRHRGLFVALVKQVMDTAFTRATRQGRPLDPPLLVVLDEAAHIAPLAELDGLAATCAGHGIQLVTVWQDLAQINARYGARAATVLNNHRARLFLPGIADPDTLRQASLLVGDQEVVAPSVTRDPAGSRSTTESTRERRLLPPEELRRLAPGSGLLVYGALPPVHLRLRPWWTVPELARRRDGGEPDRAPRGAKRYSAATWHPRTRNRPREFPR
jgi:type IV secretion system protein VirD4